MSITLETSRLILKEFCADDAKNLFELNSDPDVVKFTGDTIYTNMIEVNKSIARNLEQYEKHKRGRLSIFIKQTGEYIGWCGLRYFPESGKTDLGYRLMKNTGEKAMLQSQPKFV